MAKTTLQDPGLLAAALEGLEAQKARIEEQIKSVKAMLGGKSPRAAAAAVSAPEVSAPAAVKGSRKKRRNKLSEEARARIAEAQRKRWANFRKSGK